MQFTNIFTQTIVQIIIVFCLLDFFTGVCKGIKEQDFKSKKLRDGLIKKLQYLVIIIMCFGLEQLGMVPDTFTNIIETFIIFVECTSILENIIIIYPELEKMGFVKVFSCVSNPLSDEHPTE